MLDAEQRSTIEISTTTTTATTTVKTKIKFKRLPGNNVEDIQKSFPFIENKLKSFNKFLYACNETISL
ncbi:hypothetical protein DERF_004916 [Dermatophagoides farinae]|uniref:Uncharacterized protein n=1 Tax=Dermatophagoides farinae TaxID=6954 RepID=A0A922I2F1_DERFA|nr:hypothetical protein DERF_004916 [Dermatophagoides farinae]